MQALGCPRVVRLPGTRLVARMSVQGREAEPALQGGEADRGDKQGKAGTTCRWAPRLVKGQGGSWGLVQVVGCLAAPSQELGRSGQEQAGRQAPLFAQGRGE